MNTDVIDMLLDEFVKVQTIDDPEYKQYYEGYMEGLKFAMKAVRNPYDSNN